MSSSSWTPLPPPPDLSDTPFLVGTSGYYFDDWIGRFNPPRVSGAKLNGLSKEERQDQDRLHFYQKYFSFVEINHSFYKEPMLQSFVDIEERSKPSMVYAVKVHQDISHTKTWEIKKSQESMERHIQAVSPLIETGRFYSFLIQLEDHVERSVKRLDYLLSVAEPVVSRRLSVHIEFRHISWHNEQVLRSMKDHGIGLCNTDIPELPHSFPLKAYATTDKGYIRYSGRNKEHWYPAKKATTSKERLETRNARYDYSYSPEEIKKLLEGQLKLSKKCSKTALAFNNHFRIQAIQNALENMRLLKESVNTLS